MPITKVQEVANSIGNLVLDLVSRSGRALGRTLSDFSIGLNLNIRGQRPQAPPQSHGDEQTGPFVGTVWTPSTVERKVILPGFAAYFGTSKSKVYRNNRPPSAIAAVRSVRLNRRPTPQVANTGPNIRPRRSVSMRVPTSEPAHTNVSMPKAMIASENSRWPERNSASAARSNCTRAVGFV